MLIKDCNIIYLDRIEKGSVLIENGKIKKINPPMKNYSNIINAKGLYLSPGFIDIHIHGAGGCDTMDGTKESLNTIAKTIVQHGTTSFVPTTMTVSIEDIKKSIQVIKELKNSTTNGANILGAHLEGPFISEKAIGAQNPKYVLPPSIETFNKMIDNNFDSIISITLAPEVHGAEELIKYLCSKNIVCSIGHSNATYNETLESIKWGISHSTHLFNGMTGFKHREPGVVGAIFDTNITTETISDGIHISYPALRIAYKQKSINKTILISDAMMACCMDEGIYSLGGQDVIVKQGSARLKSGALAGSILTLDKAIKNVYLNSDYPLNEVVKMATFNPAKHCKIQNTKGQIKEGYDADLVIFDKDINIQKVLVNGNIVFSK